MYFVLRHRKLLFILFLIISMLGFIASFFYPDTLGTPGEWFSGIGTFAAVIISLCLILKENESYLSFEFEKDSKGWFLKITNFSHHTVKLINTSKKVADISYPFPEEGVPLEPNKNECKYYLGLKGSFWQDEDGKWNIGPIHKFVFQDLYTGQKFNVYFRNVNSTPDVIYHD